MFSSIVLARMFIVLPFAMLPSTDRAFAARMSGNDTRVVDRTRVLSLLGTFGAATEWCERKSSRGHLAIPLVDRAFVLGVPMIAKLLADLEVDLAALDNGAPIVTRRMLGGRNAAFFVPDTHTAIDVAGRRIIPAADFVDAHRVKTVFGMGGAYLDGTLAVAVLFTNDDIDRIVVDRFPNLISAFKMATADHLQARRIYPTVVGSS